MKAHIYNVIALTYLALVPFAGIQAQEAPRDITLDQARELAIQHNKDIAKSKLTLEQTKNDAKAYKTNFFPRINLMAADLYSSNKGDFSIAGHLPIYTLNPATGAYVPNVTMGADGNYIMNQYADIPSQEIDYKIGNVFLGSVSLTQPLYMGGKITAAYRMASRGAEMAEENIRLTESQVIVKADEAYMQAVLARRLADVARSYKELLDELLKNVESAVNHGLKTRNDLLKVQVKVNEAELAIQRADNGTRLSTMNLCHIMGLPLNTPLTPQSPSEGEMDAAVLPSGNVGSVSARPEAAILQAKTDIAKMQIKLTRSGFMPQLALFAGYSYVNGVKVLGHKLIDGGSGSVGATLKVPVLTFGERTYKARSAKARYQIAQTEQQDLTEQMQLELAQADNNYAEARTELNITSRSLAQAEENMRLARQQYDVGLEPLSNLLDAQALWQQASADHVKAQCQLQVAHTKLLKAQGNLR